MTLTSIGANNNFNFKMEKVKRRKLTHRRQLEDVPELIHHIQALLPAKDAARTCVLSKSWLRAWSTIPTLRFCQSGKSLTKQQEKRYLRLIRRTIRRYHRDNIPIITCDIHVGIRKPKSVTCAEKFIKRVASKRSLKELCLTVVDGIASFTLPDEIFSSENLNTLSIKLDIPFLMYMECFRKKNYPLHISSNPLMVCVNLRVLELLDVHIDHEEVLHNLLSTCKLLEKINLRLFEGLDKLKVNNLLYLQELKITPYSHYDNASLEIYDVPRLCSLSYNAQRIHSMLVLSITDSIGSLRELSLKGLTLNDDGFCNIINTKFPFLESLTLYMKQCRVEILDIRSNSLQRLKIGSNQFRPTTEIQVNAPKLLFFEYAGFEMPSLLFPTIVPEQILIDLMVNKLIDHLFFLKLREYLNLSSKFNIGISSLGSAVLPFKIDDVRTRVLFPATNVENLSFETFADDGLLENSVLLFDALFSICQPLYVEGHLQMSLKAADYFLKLIDMGVTENKSGNWPGLKSCEIRNGLEGEWEMLTSSSLSLVGEWSQCVFKLAYCSP